MLLIEFKWDVTNRDVLLLMTIWYSKSKEKFCININVNSEKFWLHCDMGSKEDLA